MAHVNPVEVEKSIKGINFPAKKQELVKHAQEHGANREVIDTIEHLPKDNFNNAADVAKAVGEMDRQ